MSTTGNVFFYERNDALYANETAI